MQKITPKPCRSQHPFFHQILYKKMIRQFVKKQVIYLEKLSKPVSNFSCAAAILNTSILSFGSISLKNIFEILRKKLQKLLYKTIDTSFFFSSCHFQCITTNKKQFFVNEKKCFKQGNSPFLRIKYKKSACNGQLDKEAACSIW